MSAEATADPAPPPENCAPLVSTQQRRDGGGGVAGVTFDLKPLNPSSKYVKLNVGGSLHYTTVQTLTKQDTMLKAMFSGRMEVLTDSEGIWGSHKLFPTLLARNCTCEIFLISGLPKKSLETFETGWRQMLVTWERLREDILHCTFGFVYIFQIDTFLCLLSCGYILCSFMVFYLGRKIF